MAKKIKPRKKTAATAEGTAPRKRGRQPNKWIEGFSAQQLVDYRKKHDISEAKAAKYLDTTLTSFRNWVGGQSTPSEAKQKAMQELISKDYVAPPEGEKKPRGRPKKAAAPEMTMSVAAARSAVMGNGDGHTVSSSALSDVVAAYVRRLPADRSLSMEDLEAITARIKAMLSLS